MLQVKLKNSPVFRRRQEVFFIQNGEREMTMRLKEYKHGDAVRIVTDCSRFAEFTILNP